MPEVVVKADKQRLSQVDVLGGDDEAEGKGSQYEYAHSGKRTDDDRLRVVLGRIVHIHNVHAHHLHTRIKKEYTAGQHYIIQFGEVGEEALGHIHIVMSSCTYIYDTQHDQQAGRDDRADHSAPFADLAHPSKALEGDEGRDPIYT